MDRLDTKRPSSTSKTSSSVTWNNYMDNGDVAFSHWAQFDSLIDFANTWMGSSSSHCPDTSRSPYSPMHQDATCTSGCCNPPKKRQTLNHRGTISTAHAGKLWNRRVTSWSRSDLGDVVQQRFVESLHCVGVHLHTVRDQLDEVGNGIVPHVASCLWRENNPFECDSYSSRSRLNCNCDIKWYLNPAGSN